MAKDHANHHHQNHHHNQKDEINKNYATATATTTTTTTTPEATSNGSCLYDHKDFLHIQDRTAKFKQELIHDINEKSDKFREEIETLLINKKLDSLNSTHTDVNNNSITQKRKRDNNLQEKVFQSRESLLTELFRITHIRTLRHIFIAILIIILFQIIVFDLTTKGSVDLDFDLLFWCFTGLQNALLFMWLPMQLATFFVVYYSLKFWAFIRINFVKSKFSLALYDFTFLFLYISYQLMFIYFPLHYLWKVSVGCRITILMEQVRLLMKSHAFVRHNIPRVLSCYYAGHNKKHDDAKKEHDEQNEKIDCLNKTYPKLTKYLYFLFAPTLVYRDEYPRTMKINWKLVIIHFIEVFGSIIYTYCLFDRFCVPLFRDLKIKSLNLKTYIYFISVSIMPGALIQMMTFFAFLHAWHNAWAEMLRFGDRQFYLDWWNSTSFNKYYRTWNTLVQDWLYNYIYRDLFLIFGYKYRPLSQFGVIFISSIFHEHILSFTFGFFYPIMFFLFAVLGFIFMFVRGNNAAWNVFIWVSLFTGIGIQMCLFSIEFYARNTSQCPRNDHTFWDYLIPRSLTCI